MIPQDEQTIVDSGTGYTISEMKTQSKVLPYLKTGAIVTVFEGIDRMLDFITEKMPEAKRGGHSADTGRDSFHTFDTYEEAMDTFRKHPEKVVKFDPAELRVKDVNESGTNVEYDVTGDFIDMGRYMEGIPESVGTMRSGNARNRRVSILLSLAQTARIDKDVIAHRGERILRLIDALETGGIRTQLTGIESSQCSHIEIVLKHHDEPLTITDLAVAIHPDFLRRAIFRVIEHSKTYESGYGSAIVFEHSIKPELVENPNNDELDIIVDGNFRDNTTVDRMFDKLEKLLVWEMSKPVPEVSSVRLKANGLYFNPNGARSESEIRREGLEVINAE